MKKKLLSAAMLAASCLAAPLQAAEPVKIGLLADFSSILADQDGLPGIDAMRMAVEDFGGTVLGRPIEVQHADHQNKVDIGLTTARKWYDADGMDVIVGISNSAVALGVQNLAREKHKLSIIVGAASSDLTGPDCSPTGFQWLYDSYSLAQATVQALQKQGSKSWYFVTADYTFGKSMQRDFTRVINAGGGKVVGSVTVPQGTADFSSALLEAASSSADTVVLANVGSDFINSVKQAHEFGITQSKVLTGSLVYITDIHSIGLDLAQKLKLTASFYWDQDDATRAWSARFLKRTGKMPTQANAGDYSAVLHYLKAVQAAGTTDAEAVAAKMRELPVEDFMTHHGKARADGRVVRDLYQFEVKSPAESKSEWDLYKYVATIPGDSAFRPLADGGCPFVK